MFRPRQSRKFILDYSVTHECRFLKSMMETGRQAFVVPGESSVQVVMMCRDVGKKKKDERLRSRFDTEKSMLHVRFYDPCDASMQ